MIDKSVYCKRILERNCSKALVMTEKNYEDFQNSTKCWICKKQDKKEDVKVEDHCDIEALCIMNAT